MLIGCVCMCVFGAAVFMEPSPGQWPGFHRLLFKKVLALLPGQEGRRRQRGRGLLVRDELEGTLVLNLEQLMKGTVSQISQISSLLLW